MPSRPTLDPRSRLALLVFALVATLSSGCVSLLPSVEEPLRVGTLDDLGPDSLGFRRGVTTTDEARAALAARGLTGIADASYASPPAPVGPGAPATSTLAPTRFEVLAADYQSRVHLFENDRYRESIVLPTGGVPPYGVALGLGEGKVGTALLVLYRDPLARRDAPPTLLGFELARGRVALASRASLPSLVARHHGMTSPALIGSDLDAGVMLVARDRHGALWDESYLVRFDRGAFSLKPRAMTDALRCSCVRNYAYGAAKQ
ncbi:MAG TPA: hypothetical protein VL400_24800 [Polyangiaceae bacterium]|jgi:hypothetical protein|nr:hypothetical protein [Polyangiaceae bacterium]